MNPYPLIVGALFGACVLGCQHSKDQKETQILFNGQDLSGGVLTLDLNGEKPVILPLKK